MKQPIYILENGTPIRTHDDLDDTRGMWISVVHLNARRPSADGVIAGVVPGHGGDVYWVRHGDEPIVATYCFTEFELREA